MEGAQGGPCGGVPLQELHHRPLQCPQLLCMLCAQCPLPWQRCVPLQHFHDLHSPYVGMGAFH